MSPFHALELATSQKRSATTLEAQRQGYIEILKPFLHVLVGAGFPHIFQNALKTLVQNTDDDVLAIYNRVSPKDQFDADSISRFHSSKRVKVIERTNEGHRKVGGLYSAYNLALDWARGSYEYVSFIQADMQVLRWPKDAKRTVQLAFENPHNAVFCVSTSLRTFGFSSSDHYSLEAIGEDLGFRLNEGRAVTDVGVFSMALVESEYFRFDASEGALSARMLSKGFQMAELDRPWLVFVPWPPTVRDGRLFGMDPAQKFGSPVLKQNSRDVALSLIGTSNHWSEIEVVPAGYWTLFPYWPSDMQNSKWFERRLSKCRELGIGFFTSIDTRGNLSSFLLAPWGSRHPTFPWLIARILAAVTDITVRRFRGTLRWLMSSIKSRN